MATTNPTENTSIPTTPSGTGQQEDNSLLKKEEIREVVEETVETVLKAQQKTPVGQVEEDTSGKSKKIVLIVVIVLIVIALVGALAYFLFRSGGIKLFQRAAPKPVPPVATSAATTTPLAEASPTSPSTSSAFMKSDIKIQVLNGSGVAGLAGKVKDSLTTLGFTNIETGNAEGTSSATTVAVFIEKIPQAFKDDIVTELGKTFTTIDSQKVPSSTTFDAIITTGTGIK